MHQLVVIRGISYLKFSPSENLRFSYLHTFRVCKLSEAGVRISLLVLSPSLRRCHWSLVTCVPVSVSAYVVSCVRGLELGKWSEARTADRGGGLRGEETPRDQVNTEASHSQPEAREDTTSQPEDGA